MKKISLALFRLPGLISSMLISQSGVTGEVNDETVHCKSKSQDDETLICNSVKYKKVGKYSIAASNDGDLILPVTNCGPDCTPNGGIGCSPVTQVCGPYDLCEPQTDGCSICPPDYPDPPDCEPDMGYLK